MFWNIAAFVNVLHGTNVIGTLNCFCQNPLTLTCIFKQYLIIHNTLRLSPHSLYAHSIYAIKTPTQRTEARSTMADTNPTIQGVKLHMKEKRETIQYNIL